MKDKICYIAGAGDQSIKIHKKPRLGDLVIAADGGYDYFDRYGIVPDLYIGDSDSVSSKAHIESGKRIFLPKEKDETDMFAAVKQGIDYGCSRFYIYGGTGGRFEHTFANLQVLAFLALRGLKGFLFDQSNIYTMISDDKTSYDSTCTGYISIFSFSEKAEGVTINGLKYKTQNTSMCYDFPLGISNEFIGEISEISVQKGLLLIVCNYLPLGQDEEHT